MGFITLSTTDNTEIILNVAHIISIEGSSSGGTIIKHHTYDSKLEFVEKPNQVIFMLRGAGATVITG